MTSKVTARRASRADEARQLIRLSRKVKEQRVREHAEEYPQSAVRNPK